ncbi:MAG: hypothetical protein ACOYIE_08285, partial [Agathobaculum sp.]|uniref:hypothetical protein n=1 Tax=Agathobaculum sp. TaxID=2048138 RepID=UPI003D8B6621
GAGRAVIYTGVPENRISISGGHSYCFAVLLVRLVWYVHFALPCFGISIGLHAASERHFIQYKKSGGVGAPGLLTVCS